MINTISTPNAPAAVGPYSQAIKANGFVFVSGQLPLVPETGDMIEGDVSAATRQVLENIKAILTEAGVTLNSVVKCEVFLKDMGDFAAMNEIYAQYFTDTLPARQAIQAAALPKDADIEISCIATI